MNTVTHSSLSTCDLNSGNRAVDCSQKTELMIKPFIKKTSFMKFSIEKKTIVGFGLASAVLVDINAVSYWSFSKHREAANWVAHTHEIEQAIESTLAQLNEAETGQRGYIITGDESYLKLYYNL